MTERVVSVTLRARIAEYQANMKEAAASTRSVGTEAEKLSQVRDSLNLLGGAAVGMGAALAAGVGVAINSFAQFDHAMSAVAATGDDARKNLGELREAAIEAGQSTVFSATEAANAIEEMAKAGVSAKDILGGGLNGALSLAAAGGLGVADAAGIAATTLQQFGLEGKDASHVADLLAAGAGKAMGDVSDMSAALGQSGLVASQFGLSVEETTGTLAAFAQAGLIGSDAGTSFRTMLLRLANPTDEVTTLMGELGINAYDASGKFVGMAGFAGQLQTAMAGLTEEQKNTTLAMIFGQDAIRGANVLLNEGKDGIQKWTAAVDDQGYAAETAATKLDNLVGDWEKLQGALETAFITMGEGANGPLRLLVQSLEGMVENFNNLPDWAQQSALGLAAMVGGAALLVGGILLLIPQIAEFRKALDTLDLSRGKVAGGLRGLVGFLGGPWGAALAVATAATLAFNKVIEDGQPVQAELQNRIAGTAKAATAFQDAFKRGGVETNLFGNYADQIRDLPALLEKASKVSGRGIFSEAWFNLGFGEQGALDSIKQYGDALAKVATSDMPKAKSAFKDLRSEYKLTDAQSIQLLKEMPAYRDMLLQQATAAGVTADDTWLLKAALGEAGDATESAAGSTAGLSDAAEIANNNLEDMKGALEGIGKTAMDMSEAVDNAQGALNDMAEAAKADGVAIDGTNDSSLKFRDSIREVEQSHRNAAQAIIDNGGTFEDARNEWQRGRDAIIDQIAAMTGSRDEAVRWADQNLGSASQVVQGLADVSNAVNAIPPGKTITIQMMGAAEAYRYLTDIQATLRNITGDNRIRVATGAGGGGGLVAGNEAGGFYDYAKVTAFANGGFPSGIYPGGAEIHKFAEKTLPWETYISPKPDKRAENIAIWQKTGQLLGAQNASAAPSIVGAQITGSLDLGGGLVGVIDGRIVAAQEADARTAARGMVRR
jgi:TP901 family phage tail tape measure protein